MIALASLLLGQSALKTYALADLSVALPAPPVLDENADLPPGSKSWMVRSAGGTRVAIMVAQGDATVAGHLAVAQLMDGFVKRTQGIVNDQKDLVLNGWPGLESSVRTPRGLVWSRSYAVSGTVLNVIVAGGKGSKPIADKVFASIAITPKRGKGPQLKAGPVWERNDVGLTYNVDFPAKLATGGIAAVPRGNTVRRFTTYGNRRYATFVTPHPAGMEPSTPAEIPTLIKLTNTTAATSAHLKIVSRKETTVLGGPGETMEATTPDGATTFVYRTTVNEKAVVILGAVVPTCWKGNPEVARFLGSLRSDER